MPARRHEQLDGLESVDFRAGVVAHQEGDASLVDHIDPSVSVDRRKHEHGHHPAGESKTHVRRPARPQPLRQDRPGEQLQVEKKVVGIACAQRHRRAVAKPAPRRTHRGAAAGGNEPAGQQGQRNRVGERQPQVRQAPGEAEERKGEQQRAGKGPFPPVPQQPGAQIERQRGGHMRQQQCHIAGGGHTDHPRQPAESVVGEIVGTGILVPVGIERGTEPVDKVGPERYQIAFRRRLDPGQYLQRVTRIVER